MANPGRKVRKTQKTGHRADGVCRFPARNEPETFGRSSTSSQRKTFLLTPVTGEVVSRKHVPPPARISDLERGGAPQSEGVPSGAPSNSNSFAQGSSALVPCGEVAQGDELASRAAQNDLATFRRWKNAIGALAADDIAGWTWQYIQREAAPEKRLAELQNRLRSFTLKLNDAQATTEEAYLRLFARGAGLVDDALKIVCDKDAGSSVAQSAIKEAHEEVMKKLKIIAELQDTVAERDIALEKLMAKFEAYKHEQHTRHAELQNHHDILLNTCADLGLQLQESDEKKRQRTAKLVSRLCSDQSQRFFQEVFRAFVKQLRVERDDRIAREGAEAVAARLRKLTAELDKERKLSNDLDKAKQLPQTRLARAVKVCRSRAVAISEETANADPWI